MERERERRGRRDNGEKETKGKETNGFERERETNLVRVHSKKIIIFDSC